MTIAPLFSSALAPMFEQYVNLKRSLGAPLHDRRLGAAIVGSVSP